MDHDPAEIADSAFAIAFAINLLRSMSDKARMEVFSMFCKECGADHPTSECFCWRDD